MMGAICGDVIGSVYEFTRRKGKDFEFFSANAHPTDDSYHTIAMAEAILSDQPYKKLLVEYFWAYPDGGYGGRFWDWAKLGKRHVGSRVAADSSTETRLDLESGFSGAFPVPGEQVREVGFGI
jgi:hypothetical protein